MLTPNHLDRFEKLRDSQYLAGALYLVNLVAILQRATHFHWNTFFKKEKKTLQYITLLHWLLPFFLSSNTLRQIFVEKTDTCKFKPDVENQGMWTWRKANLDLKCIDSVSVGGIKQRVWLVHVYAGITSSKRVLKRWDQKGCLGCWCYSYLPGQLDRPGPTSKGGLKGVRYQKIYDMWIIYCIPVPVPERKH